MSGQTLGDRDDNEGHRDAIRRVLRFLNTDPNPYVLKGGTALMECYGLDRFSEDIDLDVLHKLPAMTFARRMEQIASSLRMGVREGKMTDVVQRVFLDYGNEDRPLKVELSQRSVADGKDVVVRQGVQVYSISRLATLKSRAYLQRDKIRDLYDLTFIGTEYFAQLDDRAVDDLRGAFEYQNYDHFDYLTSTQDDPLIDKGVMETRFLQTLSNLGLGGGALS
jgi:predicted nucleotidyltransferase component of viral defense system